MIYFKNKVLFVSYKTLFNIFLLSCSGGVLPKLDRAWPSYTCLKILCSPNGYIFLLDLGFQSVQPFPISLLLYLLYIQRLVSSNQYVKLKMQNSFNLSLFKLRMSKKCITFEPKLRFTKFKSLNWSEFHQELEFLPNF